MSGVMEEARRLAEEMFEAGHRTERGQVDDLDLHKVVYEWGHPARGYRWTSRGMVRETIRRLADLTDRSR